jgi:hypothetical protein
VADFLHSGKTPYSLLSRNIVNPTWLQIAVMDQYPAFEPSYHGHPPVTNGPDPTSLANADIQVADELHYGSMNLHEAPNGAPPQDATHATAGAEQRAKDKVNRLKKACDSCSVRKVKVS